MSIYLTTVKCQILLYMQRYNRLEMNDKSDLYEVRKEGKCLIAMVVSSIPCFNYSRGGEIFREGKRRGIVRDYRERKVLY